MKDALPLLYQSGYLTIKDYDPEGETYLLSIPNQEVRVGYVNGLLPTYTGLNNAGHDEGGILRIHVLSHLLHAQRLCSHAGEGGRRSH
ncbi:hypothetical protein [uncultured Prevotella sp.]|uniref:hypothetical protein n=1 Tax=uncultured Prevotella sp. TaxID=159272 RepID=UPI0025841FB5|nr:hypothetical protein [uncultured Prevotella sp.]